MNSENKNIFLKLLLLFTFLLFSSQNFLFAEEKDPLVLITDPKILIPLEKNGFQFSERIAGKAAHDFNNAQLLSNPAYSSLVKTIENDLNEIRIRDFPRLGVGMKYPHRLFDSRWLKSAEAHFELVGISNRMDRQPFTPNACGEIRFIYRLAYKTKTKGELITSRLPLTINFVTWGLDENGKTNCQAIANRWFIPKNLKGKALTDQLISEEGALNSKLLKPERTKSIEINLQSVRWPSTIRPDLAGHAEYLMRVFHYDPTRSFLIPAELENTPDLNSLKKNQTLKSELLNWIKDSKNISKIDQGIAVIPEKFLTKKAIDVAPHGLARLANRPFDQLFKEQDFISLDLKNNRYLKSPAILLRRLNDLSCVGCHQARTVAGFHLLGEDLPGTVVGNGIQTAASPHLLKDLIRRKEFLESLAKLGSANPARPLSEHADVGEGDWGSHCGLGDSAFAEWKCNPGFECLRVGSSKEEKVGQCFPVEKSAIGKPCEIGTMIENENLHQDKIIQLKNSSCGLGNVCEVNSVGFPNGLCAAHCEKIDSNSTCGVIAILQGFNQCLAKNNPFNQCIAENVRPATLRKCDDSHPCRDDYICSRTPKGEGACVPPYFLFQLRVDGHPEPKIQ